MCSLIFVDVHWLSLIFIYVALKFHWCSLIFLYVHWFLICIALEWFSSMCIDVHWFSFDCHQSLTVVALMCIDFHGFSSSLSLVVHRVSSMFLWCSSMCHWFVHWLRWVSAMLLWFLHRFSLVFLRSVIDILSIFSYCVFAFHLCSSICRWLFIELRWF